ncbi:MULTISPECIES: DUF3108 domain-containing protein [Giesbergeria]|uniref:DUF3108 domain-containing protein n=1 Tax=Giesbergeria sinuosa TaxID=80883 RepID=A0ABV9QF88_9BURK
MSSLSIPHPLLWITAGVLVAHALVLQAMPLATDDIGTAPPVPVFSTRTVEVSAPVAKPVVSPLAGASVAAPPQRKGHLAPARQHPAIAVTPTPSPLVASAIATDDGHALAATVADLQEETNLGALSTEQAPPVATTQELHAAATVAPSPVADPIETVAAAVSGQDILWAAAGTRQQAQRGTVQEAASAVPVHIPAPQRLEFDVVGQSKKFQYRATAELLWQHDGTHYQARQEIKVLFLGSRTQSSSGTITPSGLQPLQFADRSRREQVAHFDYEQGVVRFSTDTPEAVLLPGTQDRLSVFIQIGALLAAAPERYRTGTRLQLATVGGRSTDRWTFRIEGTETLELPSGPMSTLKLQRLPRDAQDDEQQAQLWLAPSLDYLPARIRLTQGQGDFADLRLRGHGKP